MSVLVTGGAGYIGSHMALELLDAGEDVVIIDNLSTGVAWTVPAGAAFVRGDVGDQELVGQVLDSHKVDAIVHFAGSVVVPDSVSDPLGYYLNNTVKSRALLEAAVKHGVGRFIFSSTAAVYGMTGDAPVDEDAPLAPLSPYGSSKRMTEIMLADVSQATGLRYVALRYFNVAGADPRRRSGQSTPRATHLIKVACETALGKRSHIDVFGTDYPTPDGTCLRDYIHVSDLTRAHTAALRHLRAGGESSVFNCGYSRGFSVLEVIGAVKRAAGRDFEVRTAPRRPGDPGIVVAATDRIRKTLGWVPKHDSLDTIVGHALAWEEHLSRRNA
ncbi:MAG TPA: UDP-glucose 4-epimerase GalE [Hyphomicrobiaceae bacterium]|nr:UDP-glucose 4-epimerase GalE [Hyphomicrobiaceae bacterium]